MINQNIEFIRAYFLSFDEEEQEKIFSSLSDEQKDLIVEAGVVFLSNGGVETISDNSSLIGHKRELKEVQLEYFIGLADILAAGGTNEVIEKLRRSKNLLFEEVLAEFKDNTLFENDLLAGIKSIERKDLKQDLSLLDKEEGELGIPDEEVKYAISKIERNDLKRKLQEIEDSFVENDVQHATVFSGEMEASVLSKSTVSTYRIRFWPYAVAAAVLIVFIFTIGLKYDSDDKSFGKSNSYSSPPRIHKHKNKLSNKKSYILFPPIGNVIDTFQFEIFSISAMLNNFSKESDRNSYSSEITETRYVDSLQALKLMYSYNIKTKTVVIYLEKIPKDIYVHVSRNVKSPNIIINMNGKYFEIKGSMNLKRLAPFTEKYVLDSVKKFKFTRL